MSQCTGLSVIIVILSALVGLFFFTAMNRLLDLVLYGLAWVGRVLSVIRADKRPKKYNFFVIKKSRVGYSGQLDVTYCVIQKRWRFSLGTELSSHTTLQSAVAAAIEHREVMLKAITHYERDAVVFRAGIDIPPP